MPARDFIDLAQRYRGLPANTPRLARTQPYGYKVGDAQSFSLISLDVPEAKTLTATVRLITGHAYFFIEDGVSYSESDLATIGSDFETKVYPQVTADFGQEWTPGVDSDPRITILHANLKGAAGYYNNTDEFPLAVVPLSNEREALYIDASAIGSPGVGYDSLVAHELQHLVHWHADPDEDSWVNEGLSQVAAEVLGGGGGWVSNFLDTPDTQLTYWPAIDAAGIHYAASELFFSYLLEHYGGRENAHVLVQEQADGVAGVDAYLRSFGKTFRDVFADWVAANYLGQSSGLYSYGALTGTALPAQDIDAAGDGSGDVSQFGTDYLAVNPPGGGGTFTFDGSDQVSVGIPPLDGPFWWSDRGDSIDTRLTREFDLGNLAGATLRFSTWFDTEKGWDYAYVSASTDNGKTWQALPASHLTTTYDPVQAAYGPGYTGSSDGWRDEEADLTAFAGKKVLIRFELVNDDATNLTGFAVDNIRVPELGYSDNADSDNGWQVEGFRRIAGPFAQQFIVQVIDRSGDTPQVHAVQLDAQNRAQIPLNGPVTIAVSGATEDTAEAATYAWSLAAP